MLLLVTSLPSFKPSSPSASNRHRLPASCWQTVLHASVACHLLLYGSRQLSHPLQVSRNLLSRGRVKSEVPEATFSSYGSDVLPVAAPLKILVHICDLSYGHLLIVIHQLWSFDATRELGINPACSLPGVIYESMTDRTRYIAEHRQQARMKQSSLTTAASAECVQAHRRHVRSVPPSCAALQGMQAVATRMQGTTKSVVLRPRPLIADSRCLHSHCISSSLRRPT
jgi:hypothetical protein